MSASAPSPLSPKRILIIEDHMDTREALAALLRMHAHDVHTAADGRQGLALAQTCDPDVVLVDIGLPGLDGYQVGKALREALGSRVHLLALTGHGQPADRERTLQSGFEAHLLKPIDADVMLETLASLS